MQDAMCLHTFLPGRTRVSVSAWAPASHQETPHSLDAGSDGSSPWALSALKQIPFLRHMHSIPEEGQHIHEACLTLPLHPRESPVPRGQVSQTPHPPRERHLDSGPAQRKISAG